MLRSLSSFVIPKVHEWSSQARLLHWLTFLWLLIGLTTLYSASSVEGYVDYQDSLFYLKKQLIWFVVGGIAFNLLVRTEIKNIIKFAPIGFLIVLLLIFATYIPGLGSSANGAARWLNLKLFAIQPSELIKPFLVLQSALVFGNWLKIKVWARGVWLSIFGMLLVAILMQPNLSTTALCGMTLWLIALAAGLPLHYLTGTAIAGIVMGVTSISLREYQRLRVISFVNPWADPQGNGYQLIQSLYATGSGEFWGRGLGLSQQKLFYLPFHSTDFIFAIFAEEFGFIGSVLFLIMLAIYATVAVKVALNCTQRIHGLIAIGAMILLVGQSILHMAVVIGVLPTTGLPLPFFSYGGSSMVSSLCLTGLLIRVARESSQAEVISLI